MNRLLRTLGLDVRLQARNSLYHIGVGLAVVLGVAGRSLFPHEAQKVALPAFFLLFLGGSTYIFVAGMILLEKGEGTLDALKVTPLRLREYVGSKVATLSAFAMVESVIVLLIAHGPRGFNPVALLVGIGAMSLLYTLIGVAQVARYDSVTDFLIPWAMVVMTVLQLPVFPLLGIWSSPIWYAIPTQAPLLIIEAAFRPIRAWEWVYAIGYGSLAIAASYRLARSQVARHLAMGRR